MSRATKEAHGLLLSHSLAVKASTNVDLHDSDSKNAQHQDSLPQRHLKGPNYRHWQEDSYYVCYEVENDHAFKDRILIETLAG